MMNNDNKIMKLDELAKRQTLRKVKSPIVNPEGKVDVAPDQAIEILMQTLQSLRAIAQKEIN